MQDKPQRLTPMEKSNLNQIGCLNDGLENKNMDGIQLVPSKTSNTSTLGHEVCSSRSTKQRVHRQYEISFQTEILTSHKRAFKNILRQFEKKLKKILGQIALPYLRKEQESSFSEYNFNADVSCLIENFGKFTHDERKQYQEDMKNENQLSNFIIYMVQAVEDRLKTEVLSLTLLIWQIYLMCRKEQKKLKSQIQLIKQRIESKFLDKMTDKHFQQFTKNDAGPQKTKKVNGAFLKFAQQLSETIVLVIEGYFDNPAEQQSQCEQYYSDCSDFDSNLRRNSPQIENQESEILKRVKIE